jgi:hypothetical protein
VRRSRSSRTTVVERDVRSILDVDLHEFYKFRSSNRQLKLQALTAQSPHVAIPHSGGNARVCALVAHRRTIRERSPEHFRAGHRFEQPLGYGRASRGPVRMSATPQTRDQGCLAASRTHPLQGMKDVPSLVADTRTRQPCGPRSRGEGRAGNPARRKAHE